MGLSASKGPWAIYGQRPPPGSGGSENPDLAPSIVWGGWGTLDARWGYNNTRAGAIGWYGAGSNIQVCDQAPSTLSAVNIAAAQVPTAGTALTLVSSSGAGITVLAAALALSSGGNFTVIPSGALAIDSSMALVAFGRAQNANSGWTSLSYYDPTKAIARNIRITSVGNDSSATATVAGFDLYGNPQTETITLSNASVASGAKSWKWVTSVTPAGTLSGSNVSVGTGDVYGFGIRALSWEYVDIFWNGALVTSSTGFTAADTTSPATATTGDVRGTYAVQSASNGTKKLTIYVSPTVSAINAGNVGLFGVTPA